jgi:polysaccharide biosynthesis transport protein
MDNEIEEKSSGEMFREYASLLWHWAWLLSLIAVLAGLVTYFLSIQMMPVYQATTMVMVNSGSSTASDTYSSVNLSQELTTTYSKIMTASPVLTEVSKRLGYNVPADLISVQPIQNTQLMMVTVKDTNPTRAALIANTLVSVFADQIAADQASRYADSKKSLEDEMAKLDAQIQSTTKSISDLGNDSNNQVERAQLGTILSQYQNSRAYLMQSYQQIRLAEAQSTSTIVQKDPAIPPQSPVQPRPLQDAILAAVVGVFLAAGIVFLIEFLDDSIRDPQEVTRKWGIPVLGIVASYDTSGSALITQKQPRSPVSEAFRSLRTNLQFASIDRPLRTILVTSPSPGDGKTTVAANLGIVIAQSGRSVALVDSDLRRPTVHKIFQLSNRMGLTDQFIRMQELTDGLVKPTEIKDLSVVTTGSLPPNPSELLSSEKMSDILRQLSNQFNTIIVDTPPALVVTDAIVLAPRVDGVIVVVKPTVTKRAELRRVIEQLQHVKANLLGVVINDVKIGHSGYYYRGYYANHKYGKKYGYGVDDTMPVNVSKATAHRKGA